MNGELVGRTRHTQLSLDQLAELQPGLGQLMPQISERYWILYYAARGGNWALAHYQLRGIRTLMRVGETTRPKMADRLKAFQEGHLGAVEKAIEARDWNAFEKAYTEGIEAANRNHATTGHPEIVWKLSPTPPEHLGLTPLEGEASNR